MSAEGFLTLAVVIPAHDEQPTIGEVIAEVLGADDEVGLEVIVVDDGSDDGTQHAIEEASRSERVRVVRHEQRLGRGAAVRAGIREATGDIVGFLDGDGEYSFRDLIRAASFIRDNKADAVIGSRLLEPGQSVLPYWRALGVRIVTLCSNALTNLNLTDATSACVVVRRELLERLVLRADSFDIDVELVAALAQSRARIWEIPVSYHARYRSEGRKSRRRHVIKRLARVIGSRRRGKSLLRESVQ